MFPHHKFQKFLPILWVGWYSFLFSQSTTMDSILSNGIYRTYRIYIPANYTGNNPVPLILNLHGYTSNAAQQQIYSNFMPIADTAGFLMVYPQGTKAINNNPFWNAGIVPTSVVNDTLFLNQLIDSLQLLYNIDPGRVFMTGLSNGGFMSHYMACFCNRKIKAIASVAGTWFNFWPVCSPGKIVPAMHIHGTADPTVPYTGDTNMLGADSTVMRWVIKNGCNPVASYSAVPNTNTTDGSTAEHFRYFIPSSSKSIVEFYKINNGAHTWPGSPYIIGTTNQDINASAEIWRFFRQFSASDFTTSVASLASSKNQIFIFPNPSTNYVYIHSSISIQKIIIHDISGNVLFQKTYNEATHQISLDIQTFEKGLYFIVINNERVEKLVKN